MRARLLVSGRRETRRGTAGQRTLALATELTRCAATAPATRRARRAERRGRAARLHAGAAATESLRPLAQSSAGPAVHRIVGGVHARAAAAHAPDEATHVANAASPRSALPPARAPVPRRSTRASRSTRARMTAVSTRSGRPPRSGSTTTTRTRLTLVRARIDRQRAYRATADRKQSANEEAKGALR